ncbi:MAG TPA: 2-amino-4-hydroxy-6-hydroxymethyldihydropteridine diphosphokinase, partial [Microbacterium sp.]|nr:2-amino-4-hydroxy-6-hydroxymethyldihydropteridine diphosphokinase [Microbacterium sp.]
MSRRLAQGIGDPPSRESRATVEAVVALGANLGDREETLREAVHDLARLPLVDEVRAA